jgi:hypothetical protein
MTRRWIIASFLCIILLLTGAVSAIDTGGATGNGTTLRVSTSTAGSPLVQAADAPGATGQPSWIGLFVLAFGGLLTALWLAAATLSFARTIGDMRSSARDESRSPPNRNSKDGAPPADGV